MNKLLQLNRNLLLLILVLISFFVIGKVLFDSQYSVDYICELLNQSNWDVDKIGLINNFNDFSYKTYSFSDIDLIPRIAIWRNPATGLVEYKENNVTIAELSSGNAQRPLFLCKRQRD